MNTINNNLAVKTFVLILALVLSFSLARNIIKVLANDKKIENAKLKLEKVKSENEKLQKEIEKVESLEYLEKQAREKLGLAREGETVVILPEKDTLRLLIPFQNEEEVFPQIPNWKKWLNLFL